MDVTKALPSSVSVMDDQGIVFEQKVVFCKKLATIVTRLSKLSSGYLRLLPRSVVMLGFLLLNKLLVGLHAVQAPSVKETPAQPQPPVTSDDDGGWRVVSRKSRDKGKRTMRGSGSMTNAFQVLLEEQPAVVGSDPGDGAESVYLS